ncbi:MAG TPA: DUF4056 domain-containing protein [Bacteriovoracaceae bacterium]|nr:DUF4056 domain-containing protein [Bacteriovoracaceae bacterium]
MKMKIFSLCVLSLLGHTLSAYASFEGLEQEKLKKSSIVSFTRPCCGFSRSFFTKTLRLTKYIDSSKLGAHSYNRSGEGDKVGILYSCNGGFIDVSHLRDNADWAAHILFNLPTWLGSGQEVPVRNEDGFTKRSVLFPKFTAEELKSLTAEDKEKISISVGFSMALLHEIATAFNIQGASSFSVEDAYSNLLGSYLGVKAATGPLPYNKELTNVLDSTISDLGGLSKDETKLVHKSVMNTWWKGSLFGRYTTVLKRDMSFEGDVVPFMVNHSACQNVAPVALEIPKVLSNGKQVNDYYQVQAELNESTIKGLNKYGADVGKTISQHDFPKMVEAIRAKLIKSFGEDVDHQ